jgi:hypothetical protein
MRSMTTRFLLDAVISITVSAAFLYAGAGLWTALLIPFGWWNYYDGKTHRELA